MRVYWGCWRSVEVNDAGVRVGSDRLAWSEITDYVATVDPFFFSMATSAVWSNVREDAFDVILHGRGGKRLRVSTRFDCAQIMRRLEPRFLADAEERLARGETVAFGPLYIGPEHVEWLGKDKKKLKAIEQVDLFQGSNKTLFRIITRGKAWPFVAVDARKVPRAKVAVQLLATLGVKVEIPDYFLTA